MGKKSTAAKHLIKNNIPVLDSDAIVHDLYANEAVDPVNALFPGVARYGKINTGKNSLLLFWIMIKQ